MKSKDYVVLTKMLNYIEELHEFIKGYKYDEFENDKKTINACVFNLSQIGELASKVSEEVINENHRNRMAWFEVIKK